MLRTLIAAMALILSSLATAQAHDETGLYRVTMLRAAPGQWYELKAVLEGQGEAGKPDAEGRVVPYRIRHSQGDQWDFMLIQPLSGWDRYFSRENMRLEAAFREAIGKHADYELDWFVSGPSHADASALFAGAGLFHLEIYQARAGMKGALADSRIRENAIFADLGTSQNSIWLGQFGADHDVMTIGFYKDWAAYVEHNATGSDEEWETLSRAHGYGGAGDLSPQLRSFLTGHADTFAVPMK